MTADSGLTLGKGRIKNGTVFVLPCVFQQSILKEQESFLSFIIPISYEEVLWSLGENGEELRSKLSQYTNQLFVTVTKTPNKKNNVGEEKLIWGSQFETFSPWLADFIALDPR